jgi:hypothetical protein
MKHPFGIGNSGPKVAFATVVIALASYAPPAQAIVPALIYGTGQGQTYSSGATDSRWRVVATPNGFTKTPPYDSFLYTGAGCDAPLYVDSIIFNCISINDSGDSEGSTPRNWIFQQDLVIADDDIYSIDLRGSSDNGLTLFLGGSIDSSDPNQPTITGGTQIGAPVPGFGALSPLKAIVNLQQGTHPLFAVLYDYGSPTSFLIVPPSLTDVPGPLPILGAAAAFGTSRRLRRRMRVTRSTPHFTHTTLQPGPPSPRSASATRST